MGIKLSSNFDIETSLPLDSRFVHDTTAERNAILDYRRYDGLLVYIKSDNKMYQLQDGTTNSDWVEFTIQGDTGVQGIQGDTGVQGIQGDTGVQGIQGETGVQGIQGETGVQGIQGDTGTQGIQGDTGAQGIQGETGAQGETGVGVTYWDRNAVSGYLFPSTLTDSVGISTNTPQAKLHVEGDIVGIDGVSNLGSASRRFANLYLASNIDYASDLNFNSGSQRIVFKTSGFAGFNSDPSPSWSSGMSSVLELGSNISRMHSLTTQGIALNLASNAIYQNDSKWYRHSNGNAALMQSVGSSLVYNIFPSDSSGTEIDLSDSSANSYVVSLFGTIINSNRGDFDTKIRGTDATSVLTVNAGDNRVGIGTENPTHPLSVRGNVSFSSNGNEIRHLFVNGGDPGSGEYRMYQSGGVLTNHLNASGISYLNGGDIGIGTVTPADKVSINGSLSLTGANVFPRLQLFNFASDNNAICFDSYYSSGWKSTDIGSNYRIYKTDDRLYIQVDSGNAVGANIANWAAATNALTPIALNTSGYVGVGTFSPQSKLHVEAGDVRISNLEAGIVHSSETGILTSSEIINTDIGNLGTAGTIPKFDTTGFADSVIIDNGSNVNILSDLNITVNQAAETTLSLVNGNASGACVIELDGDTAALRIVDSNLDNWSGIEYSKGELRLRDRGTAPYIKVTTSGTDQVITTAAGIDPKLILGSDSTNCLTVDGSGTYPDVYTTAWVNYTSSSTIVGFSSTTTTQIRYKLIGKTAIVFVNISGTSNSTLASFTLPWNPEEFGDIGRGTANDNSTGVDEGCNFRPAGTGGRIDVGKGGAWGSVGNWTAAGTKAFSGTLIFEIS